jgi:putative transposase
MARPLRIQFENAYYHVTCRGNARQKIFTKDGDYLEFLDLLERSSEIYQVEVLAYVLMRNHFHFLVKTPLANLQEFMRHFNISYTSYYNRTYQKTGHLFQGRYKSFLIDADNYLQEISRYIHLNPVRIKETSGLTLGEKRKYFKHYRWSSYPGYLFRSSRKTFIFMDEVLAPFGGATFRGRKRYERFVEDGITLGMESPLEKGKGHGIVGEEEFVEKIRGLFLRDLVRSREVPAIKKIWKQVQPERVIKVIAEELNIDRGELLRKRNKGYGRGLLMEMLYRYAGMNQREIGDLMGIDYSAVSVGRRRFQALQEKDKDLMRQTEKIKNQLSQL